MPPVSLDTIGICFVSNGFNRRMAQNCQLPMLCSNYNRPMRFPGDPRRKSVALLAGGVLLVFALLGTLEWFNTSKVDFLNPETYGQTIFLTALESLLFLLLLLLLVLLFRTVLKVYVGQGSSGVATRLRSRMVLGAVIITLTPAALMCLFSYYLMNRSLERWFSPNSSQLRDDSTRIVVELADYVASNARGEAESIAASGAPDQPLPQLQQVLASHRVTLQGGFVEVYDKDRHPIASFQAPAESTPVTLLSWADGRDRTGKPLREPLPAALLWAALRSDMPTLRIGADQYALGMAATSTGKIVVAALPMPQGLNDTTARIRAGTDEYWRLFRSRRSIRNTLSLLLLLVTVFVFFSSVWLAVFLSKQITRPVEALADAMDEIAAGKYSHRVETAGTGEMSDLVRSFNHMAADLDASRQLAETSQSQLTTANQAIEERRRELETIVETIPSGVVTLDSGGVVLQSNRAFADLIGRAEESLVGERVESLFPAECVDDIASLIRRGQRMGAASTEMDFPARNRTLHLAVTSARLELSHVRPGTVLVVEDTTELLRAQRQLAWKEVAQRVAHEIKNPLTPIALSAERIGRHLDRGQSGSPDSTAVIRKCSEVILGCVGTLRTLVDQFSALAQFPATQPRPCDVNQVAEQALALFAGRLDGITVQLQMEPELPLVLADPEAIRRALANLIDNAAEAMQGSLLRLLGVHTSLSEDGAAVEVVVSDTGHGLTDQIRERLFLPFYSTKHRGTGLGLAIAAKIVQEHGGTIRAESNSPKGARFVLRLPLVETAQPSTPEEAGAGARA
jgi:two-component system, NtrC family, nitrogen regulation sensor histidine kinase NtrY